MSQKHLEHNTSQTDKHQILKSCELIEAGVCREQARGVLPQNLYTEYYATANLNNILKFVDLRTHEGAQWEIQQLAKGMLDILTDLYPITVEAWKSNQK
jgi:thymidylate synthase (FAD)